MDITIEICDFKTYTALFERRNNPELTKDLPSNIAKQKKEDDIIYWKKNIESKKAEVYSIKLSNKIIGLFYLFDFKNYSCESGITIFESENRSKDYGYMAYSLLLEMLQKRKFINTWIYTKEKNIAAKALFHKLGYLETGDSFLDESDKFIKYSYQF